MSWITVKLLGYRIASQEGVLVPQQRTLNFIGATVEDDPENKRTNITVTGMGVLEVTGVSPIVVTQSADAQHLQVACAAATTISAGSLSAADKTKLDGLPAGDDIAPADAAYWLDSATVPALLTNAVPTRALTAQLVISNASGSALAPARINRKGDTNSVLDVFDLGRTLESDTGATGIGSRVRWFLPDGFGADTHVASLAVKATTVLGNSVSTRLIVSTMDGSTLGERIYINSDGSLRVLHYGAGRALFDADGNITSSAITEAEVRAALAAAAGDVSVNYQKITALGTPVAADDAATKGYVDSVASGLQPKRSVFVATTGPITLSGTQTIDGQSVTAGKRVLVKDQADPTETGFYVCDVGPWTRADDLASGASAAGVYCFIETGATYGDTGWVCTSDAGSDVVDTDGLSWTQFTSAGETLAGAGLTKTGLTIDIVAADGSITVNADSIAASGSFGAKNISQTGVTFMQAGTLGFIGPALDNPGGVLTLGATSTQVTVAPNIVCSGTITERRFKVGTAVQTGILAQTATAATVGTPVQNGPVVGSAGAAYDTDDAVSRVVQTGWMTVPVSGTTVGYVAKLVKDAGAGSWSDAGMSFDGTSLTVSGSTQTYRVICAPSTPASASNEVTFDLSTRQHVEHAITENTAVSFVLGAVGQEGTILFTQPASGKTVTMPAASASINYSNALTALGVTAMVDTTASQRTILRYYIMTGPKLIIYGREIITVP